MKNKAAKYNLISWNVNGIRAAGRKGFLDWFKKENPDVLCLQETKAQPDQLGPELLSVPGYRADWSWAEKKGYSGVATYSRPRPVEVAQGLGIARYDCEGRVLAHHFPEFSLFNVYFPNGKRSPERLAYKMDFYADFLKTLEGQRKKGRDKIVVCGDVNTAHKEIDLARSKENRLVSGFLPQECAWIDQLIASDFIDAFREFEKGPGHYTWWDMQSRARERNVGWRIDYFFISANLRPHLRKASILAEVMGSDHCPVGVELVF
ncbi:MAG: exodeoxyribonuclease III [Elusimicrobia bacterium]|nr:exodeoxyribonuclease III [Elusimicrobiota bacterium]